MGQALLVLGFLGLAFYTFTVWWDRQYKRKLIATTKTNVRKEFWYLAIPNKSGWQVYLEVQFGGNAGFDGMWYIKVTKPSAPANIKPRTNITVVAHNYEGSVGPLDTWLLLQEAGIASRKMYKNVRTVIHELDTMRKGALNEALKQLD